MENYRPNVKDRLKINYEACRTENPRIVYAEYLRFGQDGPYGGRPGFDQIRARAGRVDVDYRFPGQGPLRVGVADRRPRFRYVHRHRGADCVAAARGDRGRAVGALIAARSADCDARFPSGTLDHRQRGAGPSGQRSPHQYPDRRVSDDRRLHQYRSER